MKVLEILAKTGRCLCLASNETVLGGHCVMAVGYDDAKQMFIIRNSWGDKWGDHGYFYMPYAFINSTSYCDNFWTIRIVE